MPYKIFFKPFVTIPVAPLTTDMIIHFMFHIRCISVYKLLRCSLFYAFFCMTFLSAGIVMSVSKRIFSFLCLIIITGGIAPSSLFMNLLVPSTYSS
jgi:hypothetical protein